MMKHTRSRFAALRLGLVVVGLSGGVTAIAACGTSTDDSPLADGASSGSSGGSRSSSGASGSSGSSGSSGQPGSSGSSGSSGQPGSSGGSGEGGVPDGGRTDASEDAKTAPVLARFDPIPVIGRTSTYQITDSNVAAYPNGTRTATVQATGTYFGRANAFQIQDAFRVPQSSFFRHAQGIEIAEQYDPAAASPVWVRVMDDPPLPGRTWTASPGVTFTSSPVAAITVPAGTFADCVQVARTPGTIIGTYCRGVGLVQQMVSFGGAVFNARLTAKNF